MRLSRSLTPCLWFDHEAEEAARFYTQIFSESRIVNVTRYGEAGQEFHRKPVGSVMTVTFVLAGQEFTALNGGPHFKFNEAISFQVHCETQDEVDYYWERLSEGGDLNAQQCGWLKDRFGGAGGARTAAGAPWRPHFGRLPAGDGRYVQNEEARYRGGQTSVRGVFGGMRARAQPHALTARHARCPCGTLRRGIRRRPPDQPSPR